VSAGRRQVLLGGLCLAGGAARAAVPMQMAGGQMVVPVVLDGQMARMVVDTGAERTVLTRAAVARLGLRLDPYVDSILRGAGGRLETYRNADVGHASLGGMRLTQRAGAKLSLSVTDMALGADGLLGGDLLRHFTLTLDFAAGTLALGPAGSRAGGNAVALRRLWPDLLLAPVRLDGRALVALVDTGAAGSMLNRRGMARLGLTPAALRGDRAAEMGALGGRTAGWWHRFASCSVGSLSVPAPLMLVAEVPEPGFDMILGLDILGRQRLALSYGTLMMGLG
jgi:predicted aspartyl protease